MKFNFKLWIESDDGKPILGKGGVELVKAIIETGSISGASEKLNLSYKFAWEYVKRINESVGGMELRKGGKNAGGTEIPEKLKKMLEIYSNAQEEVEKVLQKYTKMINELG